MNYREFYSRLIDELTKIGREPISRAYIIIEELTNKKRHELILFADDIVEDDIILKADEIIERLKKNEPLQYILGHTNFMNCDIIVDESVLIPRFDSEILVNEILNYLDNGMKLLEIGCGSLALSIGICKNKEDKEIEITSIDISEAALKIAKKNMELNKVKIDVFKSDIYSNVASKYDIIFSNPPYINSYEIENLDSEVKDYEPRLALDGGNDGLYFYKRIISDANKYLFDDGYLFFEIGYDQGEAVTKLLIDSGFVNVKIIKDLNNKDRVVIGKKG